MSLVVFPFKTENPEVVANNIRIAAAHPRVDRVLCIGVEEESTYRSIAEVGPIIAAETATRIDLVLQDRIGTKRPGKGDGMNSALRYFLENTDAERIHFHDSDITSFEGDWITKAEETADLDYGVVRHYFPRASTDAMITWLITRTGFAILWPHSELPWVEQPLGGELLLSRGAAEHLVADPRVQAQSDWGIDTLYTFSLVQAGVPMFETYIQKGKAHKLYGRLTDLRTMLAECFTAIQDLKGEPVDVNGVHRIEYPDVVPSAITEKVGYDIEATMSLLPEHWTERQEQLLELFPTAVRDGMLAARWFPVTNFMDEAHWYDTFRALLAHFDPEDEDWRELIFKLWVVRVLCYTMTVALHGFDYSTRYLHAMVSRYLRKSAIEGRASDATPN